ncbi:MAG: TraR/DksA family transcriptional regulator [Spirochaetales bacterium]|nr:TraR/DksA family transcriptional regulator [Spirochaetales bacterium]
MDKEFINKMEKILLDMKEEIYLKLASENEEFKELIEDKEPKDLADLAADDIDKVMLKTLEAQDIKTLHLIDGALSRIGNGYFGKCMKCGDKIPEARIEAIPYTFMCIKCKSSDEKKRMVSDFSEND